MSFIKELALIFLLLTSSISLERKPAHETKSSPVLRVQSNVLEDRVADPSEEPERSADAWRNSSVTDALLPPAQGDSLPVLSDTDRKAGDYSR